MPFGKYRRIFLAPLILVFFLIALFLKTSHNSFKTSVSAVNVKDIPQIAQTVESMNSTVITKLNNKPFSSASSTTQADVRKTLQDRLPKMIQLMQTYPLVASNSALSDSFRNLLPEDLKSIVEANTEFDGDYELEQNYFAEQNSSGIRIFVTANAAKIQVYPNPQLILSLPKTNKVHVKGLLLSDQMVAASIEDLSIGVAPRSSTDGMKVAFILFNYKDNPGERPIESGALNDILFVRSRSFKTFISETSYSKVPLSGKVFDWVTITKSRSDLQTIGCQNANLFALNAFREAQNLVEARDGSLSGYTHLMFYYPFPGCPLQSGVNLFALSFTGVGGTAYISSANDIIKNTATIFGFFMGIHSSADTLKCWDRDGNKTMYSDNCQIQPGLDMVDPMGNGDLAFHYNNIEKYLYLNFLDDSSTVRVSESGDYTLNPIEATGGTRLLKVLRPNRGFFDPKYWYIEFRRPIGFFGTKSYLPTLPDVKTNYDGIFIRTIPEHTVPFTRASASQLIMNPKFYEYEPQVVGDFKDEGSNLKISLKDIVNDQAIVHVEYNDGAFFTLPGGAQCNANNGPCGCTAGTGCRNGATTDMRCCHAELSQCIVNEDGSGSQACTLKFGEGTIGEGPTGDGNLCKAGESVACLPTPTPPPYCLTPESTVRDVHATCGNDGAIKVDAFLNGEMTGGITYFVDEVINQKTLENKCYFDSVDWGNSHKWYLGRNCGTMYYNYNGDQWYKLGQASPDTVHYFNTADMRRGHYVVTASIKNVKGGTCKYLVSMNQSPSLSKLSGDCDATTGHDFAIVSPKVSFGGSQVKFEFGTKKVTTTTSSAQVDVSMAYPYEATSDLQGGGREFNHPIVEVCHVAGNPVESAELYYKYDIATQTNSLDSSKTKYNVCLLRPNYLLNTTDPAYAGNKSFNFASGSDPINTVTNFTFLGETRATTFKGEPGKTYRIKVHGQNLSGGCEDNDYTYVQCPVPIAPSGSLDISPNPCIVPLGGSTCSTAISYGFSNTAKGQVCVSMDRGAETLVTESLTPNFSNVYDNINWIALSHTYEFSLHADPGTGAACSGLKLLTKTVTASYPPMVVTASGVSTNTTYPTWRVWATTSNINQQSGPFAASLSYNGSVYYTASDVKVSSDNKFLAFSLPSNTGPQNCNVNNATCQIEVKIIESSTNRSTNSFVVTLPSLP